MIKEQEKEKERVRNFKKPVEIHINERDKLPEV